MPRRLRRAHVAGLVRIALASGIAVAIAAGLGSWRILQEGARDDQRPVDAIVVLGAAQYDGRPSPVFAARLDHAIALFRAGVAPRLVVAGGKRTGDRMTEAAVARRYAVERGVPAAAIFGEDEARNTLDSLRAVAAAMRARGLRSAVFVSDPTHMLRVLRIADDLGLEAHGSPTRTSPVQRDAGRAIGATIHELGALAVYLATGGTSPGGRPAAGAGAGLVGE